MVRLSAMGAPITFYFDLLSPYAHIAWCQVQPLAQAHGRLLQPTPVLLAGLLNAHGQKGPAEIPAKRVYTFKDAYRKAHAAGLPPLVPPPSHPFNPLLALRAMSTPGLSAPARAKLVTEMFWAVWVHGTGVETEGAIEAACERAGLPGDELLAHAKSDGAKAALKDSTERAVRAGVFGVPTFDVDGELFFGTDSVPFMDLFLRGQDPLPGDAIARWAHLPASAQRVAKAP
jgi:2-hydroxychromene-2-carboxylate isomerase